MTTDIIRRNYMRGLWNAQQVQIAVAAGVITQAQAEAIYEGRPEPKPDDAQALTEVLAILQGTAPADSQVSGQMAMVAAYRQAMNNIAPVLTDEQALDAVIIYPVLRYDGLLVEAGTRVNWEGTLKRAAVDLWDRMESDPAHAPNLWEDIVISGGYREIPDPITAGLAFSKGERGWWKGVLYESILEVPNVYTPDAYPAGWKRVDG